MVMVEKKLVIIVIIIVIVNIITTSIMAILIYIFPQMTLTGLMVMIFARQGNRKSCLVSFIISSFVFVICLCKCLCLCIWYNSCHFSYIRCCLVFLRKGMT